MDLDKLIYNKILDAAITFNKLHETVLELYLDKISKELGKLNKLLEEESNKVTVAASEAFSKEDILTGDHDIYCFQCNKNLYGCTIVYKDGNPHCSDCG